MPRISSRKYRDGSKGQPCTFRIPGCCDGGGETTVYAHIRDRHTGRSIKASDTSGADACFGCHARFDGQAGAPLSEVEWLFYALRGMQETLERRIAQGIVYVPQDIKTPASERPTRKRKPPDQRAKIRQPANHQWPSRPIPKRAKAERA